MFWFFTTILAAYLAVNGYLFARLSATLAGTGILRPMMCGLLLFFAAGFPASRFLSGILPERLTVFLAVTGAIYFAPMIYGFFFTAAADVLRLLNGELALTHNPPPFTASGRIQTVFLVIALSLGVSAVGAINARLPVVVRHDIRLPIAGPGLKVALLSDIHYGRLVGQRHVERLVELVNRESPDIVLLLGDIIDDTDWTNDENRKAAFAKSLSSLSPRLGTWAIYGNHEYYAAYPEWERFLDDCGIHLLSDAWSTPGGELLLIGRNDRTIGRIADQRATIPQILADYQEYGRGIPKILMDHQPFGLEEAQAAGVHVQFSGHTHRGQLFPFNFIVRALYEKHYGLYKRGETHYYISSGAGTWGPPVRTIGRPEIVIVSLRGES